MHRRGTGRARALLFVLVLALPSAIAATTTGAFITRGSVGFSGATNETFSSAVLYLGDTSIVNVSATLPLAHVCEYEWHSAEVGVTSPLFWTPYQKQGPCFDQRHLIVGLVPGGDNSGWLGIHPVSGGSLDFTPSRSATLEPRPSFTIASPETDAFGTDARSPDRDRLEQPWFLHRSTEAAVVANETGVALQRGPAELKIEGADVMMRSDTNTTEFDTEDTSATGPAHERVQKWLVITFDSGEVTLTSDSAPFQIAAPTATVSFDGTTHFIAASGNLQSDAGTYTANAGDSTTIDGTLNAGIQPTKTGDALGVTLHGDTRDATLGFVRVAAPPVKSSFPWLWVGVGAVALVLVGGAAVVAKKKRVRPIAALRRRIRRSRAAPPPVREPPAPAWEPPALAAPPGGFPAPASLLHEPPAAVVAQAAPFDPGDAEMDLAVSYLKRAKRMADRGEYEAAVDLADKARRTNPRVAHVSLHQGIWLYMTGRFDMARVAFDDATKYEDTGEAEYWAASCMAQLNNAEQAADYLVRALNRSARYVLVLVEGDDDFVRLRERDDVKHALEQAREKHAP